MANIGSDNREDLILAARDLLDRDPEDGSADLEFVSPEYVRGMVEVIASSTSSNHLTEEIRTAILAPSKVVVNGITYRPSTYMPLDALEAWEHELMMAGRTDKDN